MYQQLSLNRLKSEKIKENNWEGPRLTLVVLHIYRFSYGII